MTRYLVVGSGLAGATFARLMTDNGNHCVVIDKRNHAGGNVYTEDVDGIHVHKYGCHIFHTSNKGVWDFVNKHASFHHFDYKPKVRYGDDVFSFPINLLTLQQVYGRVMSPKEAMALFNTNKQDNSNLESWCLSTIGKDLYEIFVKGYTKKQWGRDPLELPSSIIRRIPVRFSYNDGYFNDTYQGIPTHGYTDMINSMLDGIDVSLDTNYSDIDPSSFDKVFYTGPIDELLEYRFGHLDYRSLKFSTENIQGVEDYQGVAVMNYTSDLTPYTRVIEHKHFMKKPPTTHTVVSHEYPVEYDGSNERYYPVNDERNKEVYLKYKKASKELDNFIFCGRLAEYKYYDMHQVIASSMKKAQDEIHSSKV